jgi:DnaJ-class molecular chaperone
VQEAYNTLSDNDKRNKYNYELKKLNKDDGLTVKPTLEREDKKPTVAKEEEKRRAGVVEIPSNPSSMGVKDLKYM